MPWGVVATAAVAAYGSYEEQKAQDDARKENKELTELGFNRERWLNEQQRKWNLEDRKVELRQRVGQYLQSAGCPACRTIGVWSKCRGVS